MKKRPFLRQAVTMNILIVDDEPSIRETCAEVPTSGMKAITVATAKRLWKYWKNPAWISADRSDAAAKQWPGTSQTCARHQPMLPVIVLTQYGPSSAECTAGRTC